VTAIAAGTAVRGAAAARGLIHRALALAAAAGTGAVLIGVAALAAPGAGIGAVAVPAQVDHRAIDDDRTERGDAERVPAADGHGGRQRDVRRDLQTLEPKHADLVVDLELDPVLDARAAA